MANPTYLDFANTLDPNDKVATIIELQNETNEILTDMVCKEGNLMTGHKTTVRTGLPSSTWRLLNYGVQPSKSQSTPVTDVTGMLEAYAEIDKELADLNGNASAFRLTEDRAFLESMNQEMAETLFYGNVAVDPEKFTGLSARYSEMSTDIDDIGYNIIDGGSATANNTSIWLIVWGDNTLHGIYPKGSVGGFKHQDLGEETLTDANGGLYQGYRTHYQWKIGLTVRDWRYAVRIANIDWATTIAGTGPDLVDLMIDAIEQIPNLNMGTPVFYMRRDIRTALRKQIKDDGNVNLTVDTVAGKRVVSFDEIPVRRVDQLLSTEAVVS
ncbi:MAG: hypothetical protein DRP09_12620 [Candidatus Thorarchaeota archaeon]|nr:MAG: hypothetical protein DRP09_12620 [Candidatus Thorarchaeota archaeon]